MAHTLLVHPATFGKSDHVVLRFRIPTQMQLSGDDGSPTDGTKNCPYAARWAAACAWDQQVSRSGTTPIFVLSRREVTPHGALHWLLQVPSHFTNWDPVNLPPSERSCCSNPQCLASKHSRSMPTLPAETVVQVRATPLQCAKSQKFV